MPCLRCALSGSCSSLCWSTSQSHSQMCLDRSTRRIFPLVYACLFLFKDKEMSLEKSSCLPFQVSISEYLNCIILPHPVLCSSVSHRPCQMNLQSCLILLPWFVSSLERAVAWMLSFPFLHCLSSYFSVELQFYKGLLVLHDARTAHGRYPFHV